MSLPMSLAKAVHASLHPEGEWKLAGGVSHRTTDETASAPEGAAESGEVPAPLRGASVSGADPVAASASGGLAHRLIPLALRAMNHQSPTPLGP